MFGRTMKLGAITVELIALIHAASGLGAFGIAAGVHARRRRAFER